VITIPLLAAAGAGAHLVRRPRGVTHVYVGPLTQSSRFAPRRARPVCGTRTRRLLVDQVSVPTDHGRQAPQTTVCSRCSVRLARRAEQRATSRDTYLTTYASVTAEQIAADATRAETRAEVDLLGLLALLVVGYPGSRRTPLADGHPLDAHVDAARGRVYAATRDEDEQAVVDEARAKAAAATAAAEQTRKQDRHDAWQEREDRIARIGITNATR
jgi:hypothetical protein